MDAQEPHNALDTLRDLPLAEVERRIAALDAERAALSLLRRSLAARDRVKRRQLRVAARIDVPVELPQQDRDAQ
jgi:hypothetical protein